MISSVGTVNYQHTTSQQIFVVSQNSQNFLNNGQPILTTQISHLQAPAQQQQHQTQILPSPSCSSNNNIKKTCSSQQQQQQTQQNQPRQHPKKRKFDPAELEEMDSTANVVIKNGLMDNIYSTGLQNSENGSQTIKLEHIRLQPQQTLYTTQQSPPTTIYKNLRIETPQILQTGPDLIDLGEWCDSRVLAKQKDYFVSGITRTTDISNAVIVEFDHPEGQQQIYQDVFGTGRYDIISDACPSASDVSTFLYFLFMVKILFGI